MASKLICRFFLDKDEIWTHILSPRIKRKIYKEISQNWKKKIIMVKILQFQNIIITIISWESITEKSCRYRDGDKKTIDENIAWL